MQAKIAAQPEQDFGKLVWRTFKHWLVPQSHLREALTTADVGAFGVGLVTATPGGPVQDLRHHWWRLPHERKEQPPHLWDCQRQEVEELGGHEAHGLACCFLFVRPLCRPR
jgi:hypothetical protein